MVGNLNLPTGGGGLADHYEHGQQLVVQGSVHCNSWNMQCTANGIFSCNFIGLMLKGIDMGQGWDGCLVYLASCSEVLAFYHSFGGEVVPRKPQGGGGDQFPKRVVSSLPQPTTHLAQPVHSVTTLQTTHH